MTKHYQHVGAAPIVVNGREYAPGMELREEIEPKLEEFFLVIGALRILPPEDRPQNKKGG